MCTNRKSTSPMLPSIETLFTPGFPSRAEALFDRHLEQARLMPCALCAILLKLFTACVMDRFPACRKLRAVFHCEGGASCPNPTTCVKPVSFLHLLTVFTHRYRVNIVTGVWTTTAVITCICVSLGACYRWVNLVVASSSSQWCNRDFPNE